MRQGGIASMTSVNGMIHDYHENTGNLFLILIYNTIDNNIFNALIKKRKGEKKGFL
jgi:hypothetical protein